MNNLRGAKIIYQESKATQPSHLYFLQKDANYCEIIVTSESGVKRKLNINVDLSNYYTKNETNLILENYYLKSEIDTLYSSYYTKSETYSQTEINGFLSGKQNSIGYTPENSANKSDSYTASSSTTYASTKALVDGLSTKQKKLSSFDESILIETDGNIEGNVSLFTEYFNQQICELNFIPTQIIGVYQDGIKLLSEEFNITLPKTITIKTYSTEKIEIQYTHLKS